MLTKFHSTWESHLGHDTVARPRFKFTTTTRNMFVRLYTVLMQKKFESVKIEMTLLQKDNQTRTEKLSCKICFCFEEN